MAVAEPRTEKGRATRGRVVDAATRLILARGVAAVSLDDVGLEARVSRGQLYHYFDDRTDLLRAVVAQTTELVLGAQGEHLRGLDSWAALDTWFAHLIDLQSDPPRGCPLGALVGQLAGQGEQVDAALAEGFARWERELEEGLTRMAQAGRLGPEADPAQLATATLASLQGGLLLSHVHGTPEPLRHALRGARALLDAARAA